MVPLPIKTLLGRRGEAAHYGYFMLSGVTSVVATTEDGESVEAAMIGPERVVGGLEVLGPAVPHTLSIVQSEGSALKISMPDLHSAFHESKEVRGRILEFVQAQAFSLSQIAACHRLHTAEERLARWLLMVRDRLQSDLLVLTQEFLAHMLGSQRSTVNLATGTLQRSGLIEYSRGRVQILDGERLESVSCSCYQVIRNIGRNLYADPIPHGKSPPRPPAGGGKPS